MILRYADYEKDAIFDADVVIIGTGAGGAAAGAELAEAGFDVVLLEEGGYHPTSSFSPYAAESVPRLYRDASSTIIFGRPQIPYVEGRCVGGSTVLNGGMTWRTPEPVLAQWEEMTGAPELGAKRMESLFARVESRVHASPQLECSVGDDNRIMSEGARKLGWRYDVNRRNQEACVGSNNCIFGCPTGAKQSTLVSYMPAAFKAGARCLTEVRADRLLIEDGRCVGVAGRAIDPRTRRATRQVIVRARAVIVAAGAVQTPYLLLKHGLGRPSRELGKNFLCHPNAKVLAVYPFDVRGWQGVSQWSQIREFRDDGIILAENMIPPSPLAAHIPYVHGEAWELMRRYNQMVVSGVLVEDSNAGTVSRGLFGAPIAKYDITALDHRRFIRGVKLLSELHFSMGAEYVMLPFAHIDRATSMDEVRKIDEINAPIETLDLFTVHLMGTARMGSQRDRSVVSIDGEVWDLPGCYVADASLFPTAIGVNPQITIMALATHVASRIAEALGKARAA
jgi:choline dehydrogenase-like flavoprotein